MRCLTFFVFVLSCIQVLANGNPTLCDRIDYRMDRFFYTQASVLDYNTSDTVNKQVTLVEPYGDDAHVRPVLIWVTTESVDEKSCSGLLKWSKYYAQKGLVTAIVQVSPNRAVKDFKQGVAYLMDADRRQYYRYSKDYVVFGGINACASLLVDPATQLNAYGEEMGMTIKALLLMGEVSFPNDLGGQEYPPLFCDMDHLSDMDMEQLEDNQEKLLFHSIGIQHEGNAGLGTSLVQESMEYLYKLECERKSVEDINMEISTSASSVQDIVVELSDVPSAYTISVYNLSGQRLYQKTAMRGDSLVLPSHRLLKGVIIVNVDFADKEVQSIQRKINL